jgi:hypothetical protein
MLDQAHLDRSLPNRVALLSVPARQFHRALLRAFLTLGRAPTVAELQERAHTARGSVAPLLSELVLQDVIQRDVDGTIRAAYPFSGWPTGHQVHLEGGPPLFAMCAIDALGLPFMVGQAARILTQDPIDATLITIWINPTTDEQIWHPEGTVILSDERPLPPAIVADCCCPLINAFASRAQAEAWQHAHPEAAVRLLTQEAAIVEARTLFEHLLDEAEMLSATPARHEEG